MRDFRKNGLRRLVARRGVAAFLAEELLLLRVQQPAAELVAERIPHDRIHADEARREMPDRKELHELHVDELRPGAQREYISVAAHVGRGAVARVEAGGAGRGGARRAWGG